MSRAPKAASKRGAPPSKRAAKPPARPSAPSKRAAKAPSKPPSKAPSKAPGTKAKPAALARRGATAPARTVELTDASLFSPLTAGEVADALRTLAEDRRLTAMYKVGRYRVICTEPLVVKPPHWMATHRLVRVVVYDYAADRCVDACVDLDAGVVAHLDVNKSQPMLSRDEEAVAVSVATSDNRVREGLAIGDEPSAALHYWGKNPSDLAHARRSAAVVFGRPGGHPTLVAVVDLLDNSVTHVVPASQW
jgi:nucleoid-associated protein YgaU